MKRAKAAERTKPMAMNGKRNMLPKASERANHPKMTNERPKRAGKTSTLCKAGIFIYSQYSEVALFFQFAPHIFLGMNDGRVTSEPIGGYALHLMRSSDFLGKGAGFAKGHR